MFIESLKNNFGYDTPIFTNEILTLFPQYTKAYVFRLIKAAETEGQLSRFDTGVYFIPQATPFGFSQITASDVANKKYIRSNDEVYGIYSGLTLQNAFSLTTQITNTPEIVTNREATRCRRIVIDSMPFILRKSRTEITKENAGAYSVLQLFTQATESEITDSCRQSVANYIEKNNINKTSLLELARFFPIKTIKNMIYCGVL